MPCSKKNLQAYFMPAVQQKWTRPTIYLLQYTVIKCFKNYFHQQWLYVLEYIVKIAQIHVDPTIDLHGSHLGDI